jgi:crossover junction endodeoxyribonuclease RuvC
MNDPVSVPPGGFLGIDPGSASGCLAYLSTDVLGRDHVDLYRVAGRTATDIAQLTRALVQAAGFVVLEQVGPMPKQGLGSTWKFAENFGLLLGIVAAGETPWTLARPQVWQRAMGCLSKGDKRIVHQRAQQAFPGRPIALVDGDAIVLALYARSLSR